MLLAYMSVVLGYMSFMPYYTYISGCLCQTVMQVSETTSACRQQADSEGITDAEHVRKHNLFKPLLMPLHTFVPTR